jgi:hypothetical protein
MALITSSSFLPSFSCPTARMAWLQWKRFISIWIAFSPISSLVIISSINRQTGGGQ